MTYRVCKSFHVESGHMLSKHPGLCRFPHGHSRRVDVVLAASALDRNEMVCDFKTLKLAVSAFIGRFDHAMAVNSNDPLLPQLKSVDEWLEHYRRFWSGSFDKMDSYLAQLKKQKGKRK